MSPPWPAAGWSATLVTVTVTVTVTAAVSVRAPPDLRLRSQSGLGGWTSAWAHHRLSADASARVVAGDWQRERPRAAR